MFVLLNELRRIRRRIGMRPSPKPGSLAVRHVDAGSCNGCEHELAAGFGPHYDLGRHGLSVTASPRHADVLLVTGAITTRMMGPLRTAHAAMPEPRLVVAFGDCACGRDVLGIAAKSWRVRSRRRCPWICASTVVRLRRT